MLPALITDLAQAVGWVGAILLTSITARLIALPMGLRIKRMRRKLEGVKTELGWIERNLPEDDREDAWVELFKREGLHPWAPIVWLVLSSIVWIVAVLAIHAAASGSSEVWEQSQKSIISALPQSLALIALMAAVTAAGVQMWVTDNKWQVGILIGILAAVFSLGAPMATILILILNTGFSVAQRYLLYR